MTAKPLDRLFPPALPDALEPAFLEQHFRRTRSAFSILLPAGALAAMTLYTLGLADGSLAKWISKPVSIVCVALAFAGCALTPKVRNLDQLAAMALAVMGALLVLFGYLTYGDADAVLWMFPQMLTWPLIVAPLTIQVRSFIGTLVGISLSCMVMLALAALPLSAWMLAIGYAVALSFVAFTVFRNTNRARREAFLRGLSLANATFYDDSTSLFTRRHFFELGAKIADETLARGDPLCLAIVDIDGLSAINQRDGYATGDASIVLLVNSMQRLTVVGERGAQPIIGGRMAGGEFALLLPNRDLAEATALAEAYLCRIRQMRMARLRVTASIGVVQAEPTQDLQDLLLGAEEHVRIAKAAGGNRVQVSDREVA